MQSRDLFTQMAREGALSRLHPRVAAVLKDYLRREKAVRFDGKTVINTSFPPWPSCAFDQMAERMSEPGDVAGSGSRRRLYSITLAVTNRCTFGCWHCYNAGRSEEQVSLEVLQELAVRLQHLGAVMVTLTGGEPLLRPDLEQICRAFDDRSCLILGTTGWGLDAARARRLREAGVFAVGISLDSAHEEEHDRLRGRKGAWLAAVQAVATARDAGLYPYVVTVGRREMLGREAFLDFLGKVRDMGALEVHLLEPCPVGRLEESPEVALDEGEHEAILDWQREIANRDDLPILSTFASLEAPDAFGCGAGITHMYVDGSGQVSPCNLVPLSFGNICQEPLDTVLERMARHFRKPRTSCVGQVVSRHVRGMAHPTPPDVSERVCAEHLPAHHDLPRFYRAQVAGGESAGAHELQAAYDEVHADYDRAWVVSAGAAVERLVDALVFEGRESVLEAGCGTGFATALLAARLPHGRLLAVDLSEGMLLQARQRLARLGLASVDLRHGDALEVLRSQAGLDLVFTSWVLGYIPLRPFVAAAARALGPGGRLAIVVHRDRSPRREMDLFSELVAEDPTVLTQRVAFDFPRGSDHLAGILESEGLHVACSWEDAAVFSYPSAEEVLEHLLRSGAGTVFHAALDPARRPALEKEFLERLGATQAADSLFEVRHDYVGMVGVRIPT